MANLPGFVVEFNCGRGTMSILWSCFTTITFVVWTVLHPHIRQNLPRLVWAIFVFFVPEAMPAGAFEQLLRAWHLRTRLRAVPGWEAWTLKQSFLIIKDGVHYHAGEEIQVLRASRLVEAAGLEAKAKNDAKNTLSAIPGIGILSQIPSDDQINRRSKKSCFEKVIAGGQAAWFMTNVVSRLAGGLQVTLLEDLTVAYTLCGLVSAIPWLNCPQDLEDGFEIEIPGFFWEQNDSRPEDLDNVLVHSALVKVIAYGMLAAFAGVHLASWKYPFLSTAEAWIWRSGAIGTLLFGILVLRFGDLRHYGKTPHWSLAIAGPGYLLARLALIAVSLAAFRQMPASAFETPSWLNYMGHIGS